VLVIVILPGRVRAASLVEVEQVAQQFPVWLHNLSGMVVESLDYMVSLTTRGGCLSVDALDARILRLFAAEPRVGVLEASRRLGVARGTVQARLDRLQRDGVVRGWGPDIDTTAIGYPVTAFATLQIEQGSGHTTVAEALARIPEVLEVHTITGAEDLWCRIVARSNADLQRVIDQVVIVRGIQRASTVIALAEQIQHRVLPLVEAATRPQPHLPG
jgi:DNA-binding Lrp family transcriptional regulator